MLGPIEMLDSDAVAVISASHIHSFTTAAPLYNPLHPLLPYTVLCHLEIWSHGLGYAYPRGFLNFWKSQRMHLVYWKVSQYQ